MRLRARPEPDRFALEIPYSNARGIAATRASFRILEETDLGNALRLEVAGERKNLGSLSRYLESRASRLPLPRRAG